MAAIVTTSMRIYTANLFLNGFTNGSQYVYLFIGRTLPWEDENSPPTPLDCEEDVISAFTTMMSLKQIVSDNVSLVIPRNTWTANTVYTQYSQDVDLFDPTSGNPPFYVITNQLNVYKCLNNNDGIASTIQPTGTQSSVITVADGYQWKYIFTVSSADVLSFVTNDWIPVETLTENDGSAQWQVQQAAIPGTIDRIDVVTEGTEYTSIPTITIVGNGTGATAVASINAGGVVGITITNTGSGYTEATVNITGGGAGASGATGNAIISPFNGHGSDPVSELGGFFVMVDCQLIGSENGAFTVTNDYRTIGLIQNPLLYGTSTPASALDYSQATALSFTSISGTIFNPDETVTGNVSGATGVVEDWDSVNKILRLVETIGTFKPGETIVGEDASGVLQLTSGTAQGGSTSTIILANTASPTNNFYVGDTVLISGGPGVGQTSAVTSYVGSSNTATVSPTFAIAPTNSSTYVVADIVSPAITPYKGNILYLENRRAIQRALDQTEDIKIVIEF